MTEAVLGFYVATVNPICRQANCWSMLRNCRQNVVATINSGFVSLLSSSPPVVIFSHVIGGTSDWVRTHVDTGRAGLCGTRFCRSGLGNFPIWSQE